MLHRVIVLNDRGVTSGWQRWVRFGESRLSRQAFESNTVELTSKMTASASNWLAPLQIQMAFWFTRFILSSADSLRSL